MVVGGIYAGLARSLEDQDVSRTEAAAVLFRDADGRDMIRTLEFEVQDPLAVFEREVNEQALDQLRTYAFGALGLLFIGSLGVGWFVAGLVLRPVGRLPSVAREISGTDLSRRIELEGPDDELKQLADTFDDMLTRLDEAFEHRAIEKSGVERVRAQPIPREIRDLERQPAERFRRRRRQPTNSLRGRPCSRPPLATCQPVRPHQYPLPP